MEYQGITTLNKLASNYIIFIKKFDFHTIAMLSDMYNCLIVTEDNSHIGKNLNHKYILVSNTRLAMTKVLQYIEKSLLPTYQVSDNVIIDPSAVIGENVIIEPFVIIDRNVTIGNHVTIRYGAKILKNTIIGDHSIIRENSIIGGQGFGVEKDENGNNLKICHFGGVTIGKHVEIGALNTIVSGTIEPTIIEDYVKIDDHVHIAHNCKIGSNSIITAGVILSGSVAIGANVWVGPNSTIKNSVEIDGNNLIGIGTVITKDIKISNSTYAGVPGKEFKEFISEKKAIGFITDKIHSLKTIVNEYELDKGEYNEP